MNNIEIKHLLAAFHQAVNSKRQVIECEDGHGYFVSMGAFNSCMSSLIRAVDDKQYYESFVSCIGDLPEPPNE